MALSFDDRLLLAGEQVMARYEERGGFISDDDVWDIVLNWTTSNMRWPDEWEHDDPRIDREDYDKLDAALREMCFEEEI